MMILPTDGRSVLLAVASRVEVRALFPDEQLAFWQGTRVGDAAEVVLTGVGKANAAGGVARVLDAARHAGVVSMGVGGSLPGADLDIGSVVVGCQSVFSDEGVATPTGFVSASAMGFDPSAHGDSVDGCSTWVDALIEIGLRPVRIATVSTGSGTDGAAVEIAARSGARAEAMEGAAVGCVAARLGVHFCEIRAISNTTGDRENQSWDLPLALERLKFTLDKILGPMRAPRSD
jgi:futalosine hydrolase